MSTDRLEVFIGPHGSHHGIGSPGYPVRELAQALRLLRGRRAPGQQAVIWVLPGSYRIRETLELGPDDSHTTIASTGGEVVFDGSAEIEGWSASTVRGRAVWSAPAPDRRFVSLYVNGERRSRPRFPREGDLWIERQAGLDVTGDFDGTLFDGSDRFVFADGDIPDLAAPEEVDVVVPHFWVQERMPIASLDRSTREIVSSRRSIFALRDDAAQRFARYWLDNVGEAFGDEAGEWYLDRAGVLSATGEARLYYAPLPGETLDDAVISVPAIDSFVRVVGDPGAGRAVRNVRIEGITFRHAGFEETPAARSPFGVREDELLPADVDFAAAVQAATEAPGALLFSGARDCVVLGGGVERVDGYAIELGPGTRGCLVSGAVLRDLGAGAVRAGGSDDPRSELFCRANEVSDNDILEGGRVYPNAVAVLFQHGADNVIAHNHIRDFFYSGISVGWVWDYAPSPSTGNLIAYNHIHDLGQGRLNDTGGIYLLGIAPGTIVRGNHVHSVLCRNYGGWGIYLDQGSSHVVIEGNVVHDCSHQAFHVNYGRENTVRHNIFAFGGESQVAVTKPEAHRPFTFSHNIVLGHGRPAFAGRADHRDIRSLTVESDLNLYWDEDPIDGAVFAANGGYDADFAWTVREPLDAVWTDAGRDRHSIVADPGFTDVAARNFRVAPRGPAELLGIDVPDASRAGVRAEAERTHPSGRRTLSSVTSGGGIGLTSHV
ncbi:right-handed parallel beta-helix repeat-containing protein [Planctomonas psychrotolerans]|uniref:right-handed parallel beta-helix repeat-containing protein n=1 Tax=Planctomonas psychrotolerans TaxID=2528712 RepID=UPI00123B68C3|nr:right-handed parallel beta-helix repeat-containing protein [Planctomonas psychrotolerans]